MSMEDYMEELVGLARKAIRDRDTYRRQRDELVEVMREVYKSPFHTLDDGEIYLCVSTGALSVGARVADAIARIEQEDTK